MLDSIKQRRAELEKALVVAKANAQKAVATMQASMAAIERVQGALDEVKRLEASIKDAAGGGAGGGGANGPKLEAIA